MQAVSTQFKQVLEQQTTMQLHARVVAEWEMNIFSEPSIGSTASIDDVLFPVESVAEPRRPRRRGIPMAIVGQSLVTDIGLFPRWRVPGEDSPYKYFASADISGATETSGYEFAAGTEPEVVIEYSEPVPVNKVVVGFETSFAAPVDVTVSLLDDVGATIHSGSYTPDFDGLIQIYKQTSTWSMVENFSTDPSMVKTVAVMVNSMNKPSASAQIIQVSPRFVVDLTERVINADVSLRGDQYDITNPISKSASSTVAIKFDNTDGLFDEHNEESLLYGMIDRNVRLDVSYVLKRPDGIEEGVPQGTFFVDNWSMRNDRSVEVDGTDRSKFLQETIVPSSFYANKTAEFIVRDMMERFGHVDYIINYTSDDANRTIPFSFWKSESTIWDVLGELALAEQANFYFDEQDRFVWNSRDWNWSKTVPDVEFRDVTDGVNLPNLIEFQSEFSVMANRVTVPHTPLEPAAHLGNAINNVVWERSEPMVLQSTPLLQNVTTASQFIYIDTDDWLFFPFEAIVNIDGEYISYKKVNPPGTLEIVERGLYNSTVRNHNINPISNFWSPVTRLFTGTGYVSSFGNSIHGKYSVSNSMVRLNATDPQQWRTTAHYVGGDVSDSYRLYGCEFIMPVTLDEFGHIASDMTGAAGLFINATENLGTAYYFRVHLSSSPESQHTPEIAAYRINGSTLSWIPSGGDGDYHPPSGERAEVAPNRRHRLEVFTDYSGASPAFTVFLDGRVVMAFTDNVGGTRPTQGKWGVFNRGAIEAHFEAVWALDHPSVNDDITSIMPTFRDRTDGSFRSGTIENMWTSYNAKRAEVVFEDFGPWVHHGEEFDVSYDIAPNVATDLFISSDDTVHVVKHDRDPFGSRFTIVNKSREPSVIVGNDPRRDSDMSMFIYGRPIIEGTESRLERQDTMSIRRRGAEELELLSFWTQTKSRAERILNWIIQRWGSPNDIAELKATVYPHIQIGDLVSVNSPGDNMDPSTHQYTVIEIIRGVGSSFNMTLKLRRKR